ncbi:serum response factor homolog B-like [Diorhabda carinulata]|uniref:serum response factor homolog B-like n=1 Tax=Diorhabda carinulata TaxID=1163345 RepID=UPI0025A28F5D|nr:serum response factor homolog B-like [Diorhabda carinulata]
MDAQELKEINKNEINHSKGINDVEINENSGSEEISDVQQTNSSIGAHIKNSNKPNTTKTNNLRSELNKEENNVYANSDQNNILSDPASLENKEEYKSCIVQMQEVYQKTALELRVNPYYKRSEKTDTKSFGFKFIKRIYRKKSSVGTTNSYDVGDIDNPLTQEDDEPPQLSHYICAQDYVGIVNDQAIEDNEQSKLSINEKTNKSHNQKRIEKEVNQTNVIRNEDIKTVNKENKENFLFVKEKNANNKVNESKNIKKENQNSSKALYQIKKASMKTKKMSPNRQAKFDLSFARKLHVELNRQAFRRSAKNDILYYPKDSL